MFFGREELLDDLLALFGKRTSSLVTCRGRRRVGKSTLIETFARRADARFIRIEGLRPAEKLDNAAELAHFAAQLAAQTGCETTPPSNWLNAFLRLDRELGGTRRTVVLLDEISWMAHYDPTFAGTLKTAWDGYLKKHPRLVLVLSVWAIGQLLDGYCITPKIQGNKTGLGYAGVIFSFFFWGTVLGPVLGLLLAIPLSAFCAVLWRALKSKYIRPVV